MKHLSLLILLFAHLGVSAQRQNLIYEQTFDTSPGVWFENSMPTPKSATVSSQIVRAGGKSLRVELKKKEGYRAEFGTDPRTSLSKEWVGFSVFIPSEFKKDDSPESIVQFQALPDFNLGEQWRSAPFFVGILKDHFILEIRTDEKPVTIQGNYTFERIDLGTINKDKWTDFVLHVEWAHDKTGKLELWKNNTLAYSRINKPNCYNDKLYPYLKIGVYKWDWSGVSNSVTTERLIYIDEVRLGREKATYQDVCPGSAPESPVECTGAGTIGWEQWTNVSGTAVAAIPADTAANNTATLTKLESAYDIGDNYGARIRGYVCPPQSGNYTFQIAGDDNSQFWLSTDENPANKVLLASVNGWTDPGEWTKYGSQKSEPVALLAGRRYYLEVLHKEENGRDFVSVGWTLPNGTAELPIPGNRLIPYVATAKKTASITSVNQVLSNESGMFNNTGTEPALLVYPNPFTNQTTVEFALPAAGQATLSVYDVHDRLVQRLYNGPVKSGTRQQFAFKGTGLPPGLYLLQLITATKVITHKLTHVD